MAKQPYAGRLTALRAEMEKNGIDVYIIVTDDFHGSEYVGDYFKCREYISGFDGSAGTLVVTQTEAGLWTDGRYFLQARDQLEGTGIELRKMGEPGVPTVTEYLKTAVSENGCIGYDGRTVTADFADRIARSLAGKNVRYRQDADLAGQLWRNRPAFAHAPIWLLDDRYTGMSRAQKLQNLRASMAAAGAQTAVIASLDDIAWLYNFRGDDVAYNPVAMSYTAVSQKDAVLYISPDAVSEEIADALAADGISLRPYLQIYEDAKKLRGSVLLDRSSINAALL
ncbi:MAG: aminopeptidase P family N-terminal domain-containing protein, partial [Clostridia bacterium]|nr:aminopeptidase P family N-terminal domain-containing protein [Clostridia bacterium]